jgi:hypothetical protein
MGMLLKHGANPYFADDDGNTLLHVAAQSDAFDCATHLARYLNPNQRNRYDLVPLHIAILKNFKYTAQSILQLAGTDPNIPMAGESPLIFAIRNELLEVIRDLVGKGADVNAQDAMGNSALHLALTRRDNIPIMYELLKHGANPNAKDANGDTLLVCAIKNKDGDAVRALLQYKADPNIPDANGDTPLVHAIKNKDILAVQALIENGTNPNIPDANGVMPIFLILQQLKDLHCAFCLVDHGANLYVRDAEDNTPLHLAVQFESLVSLLINRGLDVNAVNIHGDAPLHCVESITPRSAYVLRWNGADINLKNKEGLTPYEKAGCYLRRGGSIDGRLSRILEEPTLASAIDYGITLTGLPGMDDTRVARFVELGKGSRIERVGGSQPGDCVHIGGQLWKQVVAWFCPRARNPEQSDDSVQPASSSGPAVVNPVAMTAGASAPSIGASPRDSTDAVVSIDARHNTGLRQRTYEARFFD